MIDFKSLNTVDAHSKPTAIDIMHPATGEPCGFKIYTRGPDSKEYRRAVQEYVADARNTNVKGKGKAKASDDLDQSNYALAICMACACGWEGISDNGKELAFSPELLKDLFLSSPNILDQVFDFIGKRENFI